MPVSSLPGSAMSGSRQSTGYFPRPAVRAWWLSQCGDVSVSGPMCCCSSCGALVHIDEAVSGRIAALLEAEGLRLSEGAMISLLCPECSRKEAGK